MAHTETLYAVFSLFQAIYLPSNGSCSGLVGEELLEWLNANFIAPDSDEAVELSKLSQPWEEDRFWLYLIRCVLVVFCQACVLTVVGVFCVGSLGPP